MKKITLIALASLFCLQVNAQKDVKLTIEHKLGGNTFQFDQTVQNDQGMNFKLTRLQYYLSSFTIIHDGGTRTKASDVYSLQDAGSQDTLELGNFDVTSIEAIEFAVGVETPVNNEDPSQWPSQHPLSPKAPSMHWGWAAGYRFIALEGESGSNVDQMMEIHALGNKNYKIQQIPVTATEVNGALVIHLNAEYTEALAGIDISQGMIEHSEIGDAITCINNFWYKVFTNENGENNVLSSTSVELNRIDLSIYPNPSNGKITISTTQSEEGNVEIADLSGKIVYQGELTSGMEVELTHSGIYFATIRTQNGVATQKLVVN